MTYEEMERSMEFVIQQLGHFTASVQRSTDSILEQQAKNTSDIDRLVELGAKLARRQLRTDRQIAETNKQLTQIAAQVAGIGVQVAEIGSRLAEVVEAQGHLTESQQRTDARFSAFLSALERRFGGNGRGRKSTSS